MGGGWEEKAGELEGEGGEGGELEGGRGVLEGEGGEGGVLEGGRGDLEGGRQKGDACVQVHMSLLMFCIVQ